MNASLWNAEHFMARLQAQSSPEEAQKYQRYFKHSAAEDRFIGVRMGQVFALAKEFIDMPPGEIEILLESAIHEARAGAMSIMDKDARRKKTPPERRKELYDLYLKRHDRINDWDLVDLGAPFVVGGYLFDKPRDVLHELTRSANAWERRTAITATAYFIRQGEAAETFRIAAMLLGDDHDLIHKATGGWLRAAGGVDRAGLLDFLGRHAAMMPRVMLRYAIEHLGVEERGYYLGIGKSQSSTIEQDVVRRVDASLARLAENNERFDADEVAADVAAAIVVVGAVGLAPALCSPAPPLPCITLRADDGAVGRLSAGAVERGGGRSDAAGDPGVGAPLGAHRRARG